MEKSFVIYAVKALCNNITPINILQVPVYKYSIAKKKISIYKSIRT